MALTEIVKMFGERKVPSIWDDAAENWYFSVVDVVAVLTESAAPRNYWKVLKNRLKKEGNQTVTNCNSRPFEIPSTGRIAAKIVNHLGDEVMKGFAVN